MTNSEALEHDLSTSAICSLRGSASGHGLEAVSHGRAHEVRSGRRWTTRVAIYGGTGRICKRAAREARRCGSGVAPASRCRSLIRKAVVIIRMTPTPCPDTNLCHAPSAPLLFSSSSPPLPIICPLSTTTAPHSHTTFDRPWRPPKTLRPSSNSSAKD